MLAALIAMVCWAAEVPNLTPEQQQQDFDELWAAMDEMHPSLYLHTTEEEFAQIRADVRARLTEPRSPGAFWTVVMEAATHIGCGHTTVYPSFAAMEATENKLFPRDVVVVDGVLHIDPRAHDDSGRIVSIQGNPGDQVLQSLRRLINSDAKSTAWQDFQIDAITPYILPFLFGEPESWEIVVERDGEEVALTLDSSEDFYKNEGTDPGNRLEYDRYESYAVDLTTGERYAADKKELAGRALLLIFDSFDDKSMKRHILKPLRTAARVDDVAGVVIDLRRNGGGSPWPAFELFGHLIEEDELVYDQKLFRWPFYAAHRMGLGSPAYEYLTSEAGLAELDIEDGLYNIGYGNQATVRARKPTYSGPVLVLTSGNTFSTGADMAALLKRFGRGEVVGMPSGGSATLQTSGESKDIELTHSGVRVGIPLNRSRLVDPEERLGRAGAPPDHRYEPTLDDLTADNDPALDLCFELLRESSVR